jgi:phage terminase large subunit-like protein
VLQGVKRDLIALDEDPGNAGIYSECLMRLMSSGDEKPGLLCCTFTPLKGLSEVVLAFMPEGLFPENGVVGQYKFALQKSWDEAPHLSQQEKTEMLESMSPHEIEARVYGRPLLGAGAVFPYSESSITVEPFKIPDHWPRVYGLDPGWNKTAVVWIAQDPQTQVVYAYSEHLMGREPVAAHASAIKMRDNDSRKRNEPYWMYGIIDNHAGRQIGDGKLIAEMYEEEGLTLFSSKDAIEAGILRLNTMFGSGMLKIMTNCRNLLGNIRIYSRDEDGKISRKSQENDHTIDAFRYAVCDGLEYATTKPNDEDSSGDEYYDPSSGKSSVTGY